MLARSTARACRARLTQKSGLATAADSSLKVAAVDNGQPTSSVTLVLKAGSRFETTPGAAHVLKNFAFKGTSQRSALRIVRESELHGGVLSATLGREYLALTAEFLRGDEEYFVDVLSGVLTSSKFATHELHETVAPQVEAEANAGLADPVAVALDVAHSLAFRNGLGNPLFASPHGTLTIEDVKAFAAQAFTKENVAVIGSGVSDAVLSQLVQKTLAQLPSSPASTATATKYYGGESRVNAHSTPTVFIGFGTSTPSAALSVLASYLDPTPSVKWSDGVSPLSKLPKGTTVQIVHEVYSDGALFGLLVQGENAAAVKEASTIAVQALKSVSSGTLESEELARAVSKAKFSAASSVEGREGLAAVYAPQLFAKSTYSLDATYASLDAIKSGDVAKASKGLLESKPTYVVVGNVGELPYADELGL